MIFDPKFKYWMKNDKQFGFPLFARFIPHFSCFLFFKTSRILNFLNCNRPVSVNRKNWSILISLFSSVFQSMLRRSCMGPIWFGNLWHSLTHYHTYLVHIGSSCTYYTHELTKLKKYEHIHIWSFHPTWHAYKIWS
jgi:hypothetical protein